MHHLTAQVTSSLLPFPGVTVDALGEDEITLDSVLQGKFTVGRSGLAWLACGPHLEVVHAVTGERLSAYCFSGGGESPPTVLAARDFSWLKRSGLLVGLEEAEGNVLCLYDLGLSRVVKAVVIPGRITAIEPLVSYGGASISTQHLHQSLRWFFGIAAVVTDVGHVLLVDLCLDDLSGSQSELEASALQVVTKSPTDIPRLREVGTRQGRHLCLQLNSPSGVGVTSLQYISRTNQLAVGFSNGYLQLWNMKTLKKEYDSQLEGAGVAVYAFTFQEPENDPRNCCYLWAVQSSQELEGDTVSLRLLQLAFSERKCLCSGKILYEGLEYCEERYSQELGTSDFPLRAQTTNTRLLSCQTIEKFRPHPDRDDSMNEVASPDTSVSIFTWQVKAYGQGAPSTYVGVFDINRWYHAQMPDSLRMGESLQNCPYMAVWSLDPVVHMVSPHVVLDVVVHDRSLSRGLPFTCPPPEQYFNPTAYNFDATCLLNSGIVHLTCSGYQKETLSFLKKAAPCSSDIISTSYSRCLMSGLLSSRLTDTQASSLSQEEQLDAILSTAVETSSLGLITGCIKQWTSEEQPGSALNLRYILDWAWNKVVQTKDELDGICAPLFDSSSNFTDPQTLQLLQHSQRLLGNLSTIFHCLLSEAQELTQKGLVGLINKNMVSSLISKYAQVVLWFCRTGLLPEGSDDDALQISRPFYTHSVISNYYTIRREELSRLAKGKWCADCLIIDGLVGQCGECLTNLWKRDEGGTGQYPPPTLHALLDIYLLENIDDATKHAIVIYLLLDVMHSFPDKDGSSVHSFPSAFSIPVGLVKLVQGLWLLDHHGHQSSFELLLHPAATQCHFKWQHERVLNALMCQGQHSIALRYLQVTKPPISSTSQAKLYLSVLLHNRCLLEAWSLVRQNSNRLNMDTLLGLLYESCQELGLIKELLKLPLGQSEQECLEKFLQGTGGLQNRELLMVHYLQQANYVPALQLNHRLKINLVNEKDPKLKERSNTRNSILEQYGKVLPRVQRKLAMERAKPYQPPYTIHREVSRPQPLSAVAKRSAGEKVMSRAGFINNVLTKIEEVWTGKDSTPQSSPAKTSKVAHTLSPKATACSDAFLGTPMTMTSKRKSRLLDLVVQPSCRSPQPLLSPPRPPSSWFSPKSISKAPELKLLQTPQVVKRARALAASGAVFSAFTPQSILRSSLRPTPVATPSASPGRSITPPLRSKESRITFIEEAESPEPEKDMPWTNGMVADSEISLLTRGSIGSKASVKTWPQPAEEEEDRGEENEQPHVKFLPPPEGGVPSPQLGCSESESSSVHEENRTSHATQVQMSLSFDTSQTSVRSTDTTMEYFDAPLSEDKEMEEQSGVAEQDDDIVTLNIKPPTGNEEPEETPLPSTEQAPLLTPEGDNEVKAEEDLIETCLEVEEKIEEPVQSEREDEEAVASISKEEDASTFNHEEMHTHFQVSESTESGNVVECQEEAAVAEEGVQASEFTVNINPWAATEQTEEQEESLEQSADLTEFVQQHLFGDLSPALTRAGIHSTSQAEMSVSRESLNDEEEEAKPAVKAPPLLTSQTSNNSLTSSEPTGTDSHSVVTVPDSEDLSSAESEEDDEEEDDEEEESDEEEEEEEEEEDSGSEVEIIEEVRGNGGLPRLEPTSVFVQEGHTHFLPSLSQEQPAEFALITPDVEMKEAGEDIEDEEEVVVVRVGASEVVMEEEELGESSYTELKPSTTLLVPLELVEGEHGLVDSAQLDLPEIQDITPDDQRNETHSSFSLMLDVEEEENKKAVELPMGNDYQPYVFSPPSVEEEAEGEGPVVKAEIFILSADEQDGAFNEDAVDSLNEHVGDEAKSVFETVQTDHQAENLAEETEAEVVLVDSEKVVGDQVPGDVCLSAAVPEEELPAAVDDDGDSAAKETEAGSEEIEEEKETSPEDDIEEETVAIAETVTAAEEVVEEEEHHHQQQEEVVEQQQENMADQLQKEENMEKQLQKGENTEEEQLQKEKNMAEELQKEENMEEQLQEEENTAEQLQEEENIEEQLQEEENIEEQLQKEEKMELQEEENMEEQLQEEENTAEQLLGQENMEEQLQKKENMEEQLQEENMEEQLQEENMEEQLQKGENKEEQLQEENMEEQLQKEENKEEQLQEEENMAEQLQKEENMAEETREEQLQKEENMLEQLQEENMEEQLQEENMEEQLQKEENMEEQLQKEENMAEQLQKEENMAEQLQKGENMAEQLQGENLEEQLQEENLEEQLQEENLEEQLQEENLEEQLQEDEEEQRMVKMVVVVEEQEKMVEEEETMAKEQPQEEREEDNRVSAETDETDENPEENGRGRITRGSVRKEENIVDSQSVPETPSSQKKKALSTPTKKTTRGRKTVVFISPLPEEQETDTTDEPEKKVPPAPRGRPRKSLVPVSPTRRSTRKAQPKPLKEEEDEEPIEDQASTSKISSSARRQVSQRAISTRASQSIQSGSESEMDESDEDKEDEESHLKVTRRTSSRTATPAKRRTIQTSTPRRATRSTKVEAEENELDEVFAPSVKRSSRKIKLEEPETQRETQPVPPEVDEGKRRLSLSPGRTTRASSRTSLNLYPQVNLVPLSLPQTLKMTRHDTITTSTDADEPERNRHNTSHSGSSGRPTRSKLWNHPEEDLPLLDSPLEVDSETPVADALIKRLQDEEEKRKVVRSKSARTRSTMSSSEQTDVEPAVTDILLPEPQEDESSPEGQSIIYTPSRRRTRAHRGESPGPSEETSAPVTRSRRHVKEDPQDAVPSKDVEADKASGVSKTIKTRKQSAKSKSVSLPPPEAVVELISPLPSPADPLPRSQRRIKGAEAPPSSMNLRRKRIMDTVLAKPVTRRKKL